jgi:hypothetical protein
MIGTRTEFSLRNGEKLRKYFRIVVHAVAQLVVALCYKPEGHGIDCRWRHWNFSLTQSFRPHYDLGSTQPLT